MKTSELLIRSKSYLAKNQADLGAYKTRYVCVALNDFDANPKIKRLMHRITKSMGDNLSVAGWLYINGHATREQTKDTNLMQEYRHRWLDSLIEEYRGKGD